jgi:broad specificity phosphatase PhoE
MTLPIDLVLVRHGESEGNLARSRSKKQDNSDYTPEFRSRHSSLYRLTDKGREQAKVAGEWIKANIDEKFDRYYVSEYIRAKETAALLGLPDAEWLSETRVRERDMGQLDSISEEEKRRLFAIEIEHKSRESYYWRPVGGESIDDVVGRVRNVLDSLHREESQGKAIIVCHGEVMRAFRVAIERSTARFHDLEKQRPYGYTHNCQIHHWSRRDPTTGDLGTYLNWFRSVCPWDLSLSTNTWEKVKRPRYSNEELMAQVEALPRLVQDAI